LTSSGGKSGPFLRGRGKGEKGTAPFFFQSSRGRTSIEARGAGYTLKTEKKRERNVARERRGDERGSLLGLKNISGKKSLSRDSSQGYKRRTTLRRYGLKNIKKRKKGHLRREEGGRLRDWPQRTKRRKGRRGGRTVIHKGSTCLKNGSARSRGQHTLHLAMSKRRKKSGAPGGFISRKGEEREAFPGVVVHLRVTRDLGGKEFLLFPSYDEKKKLAGLQKGGWRRKER